MSDADLTPELRALVARMWESSRELTLERVDLLASLVDQGAQGDGDDVPEEAYRIAHQLAGSLGTFGLAEGSRLAGELEEALAPPGPAGQEEIRRVAALVAQLRVALTSGR